MKFELKRPQLFAEPKTYGEYLMDNPKVMPKDGVSMDRTGYVITDVNYGTSEPTSLPFKAGDWVDAEYIDSNFDSVDS